MVLNALVDKQLAARLHGAAVAVNRIENFENFTHDPAPRLCYP
jgi:hypothetical protein